VAGSQDPWSLLSSTPGILTDQINVGGNESGQTAAGAEGRSGGRWRVDHRHGGHRGEGYADFDSFEEMKVSGALFKEEARAAARDGGGRQAAAGVDPESGKALAFSGVLPPVKVTVELDVKAKGKS